MNNGQITASDDTLMAVMQNNYFATPFYYISIANIETSATFESKKLVFLSFGAISYVLYLLLQ